jgi:hypothetical protein
MIERGMVSVATPIGMQNASRRMSGRKAEAADAMGRERWLCKMSTSVYDIALQSKQIFDRRMAE